MATTNFPPKIRKYMEKLGKHPGRANISVSPVDTITNYGSILAFLGSTELMEAMPYLENFKMAAKMATKWLF